MKILNKKTIQKLIVLAQFGVMLFGFFVNTAFAQTLEEQAGIITAEQEQAEYEKELETNRLLKIITNQTGEYSPDEISDAEATLQALENDGMEIIETTGPTSSAVTSDASGKDLAIGAGVTLGTVAVGELLSTGTGNNRTARQVLNSIGGKVAESTICGAEFNFGVISISGSEFCDIMGLFNRVPTGSLDEGLGILDENLSGEITENYDIRTYILDVVNFFLGFLGLLAVIMIIYAGFKYVTSNGNSDQSESAKKIIMYAIIGIFIILSSFALVNTVINFQSEGNNRSSTSGSTSGYSTGGSSKVTYSNSTGSYGSTQNSLQEFSGIVNTLAPAYRTRFENYVQLKEEVLPALASREEILDQILNGETDIEVTPEMTKNINQIKSLQYDLKNVDLSDFANNEDLEKTLEKAKTLQDLYATFDHSVPELDNFIENAEAILYGEDTLAVSTGRTGSPIARLTFSQVSSTTDSKNNASWKVNLSGVTSTAPQDLSIREIVMDYDTEVTGDEETVSALSAAKFERIYPVRDKVYSVSLKVTDNSGESDTVIRKFKVSEDGVTATDNNESEGDQAIARLQVTKNSNSSSNLAVIFNPTNSIPATDATITSFYIDTNLDKDSDGDGDKTHDHNLSGTNLSKQNYSYSEFGTYNAKLVITDSFGNQDSVVQEIKVSETGIEITQSENSTAIGKGNTISGIELLDYIRYGYNLNNYSLDLTSIRQALEEWYATSIPHTASISATYSEMMFALDDMIKTNNYDTAPVRHFADTVVRMLEEVANIPSIVAKIKAQPNTRGKAPFTVELNAVESYAPVESGISIDNEGYCWEGIATDTEKGITRAIGNSFYGPVQTITFNEPGSYIVRLTIPASGSCETSAISQQNNLLLSGSDTILITVLPPSSNIKVSVNPPCLSNSSSDADWGEGYDANGISSIMNGQACYISLSEARNGISFDPSETAAASGRTIQTLKWEVGNKNYGPYASPQGARVTHTGFSNAGTYYVNLEVVDSAGEKDKFSIDVHVMEIIANITASPGKGNIDTEFTFSAIGSQSDNSTITKYAWSINYLNSTAKAIYTSNEKSFKHQFEQPGKYNIGLTITDGQGRTSSTNKVLEVTSEKPVATFTYKQKSKSQPSTYILDARKSYDTDSREVVYCEWVIDGAEINIVGGEGECYNVADSYSEYENTSDISTDKTEIKQLGTGIFEYTFETSGPHEVILIVRGDNDESANTSRLIEVPSALSVDFDARVDNKVSYTAQVGSEIRFTANTLNASSFDWNFGEGTKKSTTAKDIKHTYYKSGEYSVTLRAFSNSGDSNSITKRIIIGKQDKVTANYKTSINNQIIDDQVATCDENSYEIKRNQLVTFDGSDSVNTNGTQGNLEYSWNFGDGIYAEGVRVNHSFTETSGKECFPVELTVRDKTDPTLTDKTTLAYIKVINSAPTLSGIRIIAPSDTDITPFSVSLSAINPKDTDGRIVKYTWWYYIDGDTTKRGSHETITPYTQITLTPIGTEGQKLQYYFVVEMEDNEGKTSLSTDEIGSDPFINAITGHNNPPIAFFSVDKVLAKAGEEIHFSAAIKDDLGEIMPQDGYHWDFDGDGKYDDNTSGSFASYRYNRGGTYKARLKVMKNGLSSTYEMPITIEADTLPPSTAFTYRLSDENEVVFINASQADTNLGDKTLTYAWDFDTNTDSNNDGDPANDIDSTEINPIHIYPQSDKQIYNVALKVTDASDISNEVTRPVNLDQAVLPISVSENDATVLAVLDSEPQANKYNGELYLEQNQEVTLDFSQSRGQVAEYRIDKNIYFDSDGDGNPENDVDNRYDTSFTQGGKWVTYYDAAWAPVTTQLTIVTVYGETSTAKLKFHFNEKNPTYADISLNTNNGLAYFYTEPKVKIVNEEVKFDASQSKADVENYVWDFNGDDVVDLDTTDPIASYKYTTVGEKTVKLITKSKGNITSEYTAIINISSDAVLPTANFEYIAEGNTVSFYNQSTVDESLKFYQPVYEWKFYEDPIDSETTEPKVSLDGNINPIHEFAKVGSYRVVLTVIDYYGQTNSMEKIVETTASAVETPEIVTPVETNSGSIWSTLLNILVWLVIIGVVALGGLGIFAFVMFKKNYPGHSFSDFVEYIKMTLAGEEYGPAPTPELAKDIKLPEPTPKITPVATAKPEQPKPAPTIEPKLSNNQNEKMPDWLKPKTEPKVDEPQEKN